MPHPLQDPHQLVSEALRALDHIYSAAFETPLEPSPWLAQQSEAASVCLKMETKQVLWPLGGDTRLVRA